MFEAADGRSGTATDWRGAIAAGGGADFCWTIFAVAELRGPGWGSDILAIWVGAGTGRN